MLKIRVLTLRDLVVIAIVAIFCLCLVLFLVSTFFPSHKEESKPPQISPFPSVTNTPSESGIIVPQSLLSEEAADYPSLSSEGQTVNTLSSHMLKEEEKLLLQLPVRTGNQSSALQRKKKILIYHTHTFEAYQQQTASPYQETDKWRTRDNAFNIVCVGDKLKKELENLGYEVIHDTTAFEPPKLGTAYARSAKMLKARKEAGETYDLCIDLHRDASNASNNSPSFVAIDGKECARLMLLVGKGEGFKEKPNFTRNSLFAEKLEKEFSLYGTIFDRGIRYKTGRYNQHVFTPSVLIEAGHNENTLSQALHAMPILADCIDKVMQSAAKEEENKSI